MLEPKLVRIQGVESEGGRALVLLVLLGDGLIDMRILARKRLV